MNGVTSPPKVSVLVPAYEAERFVDDAIRSVLTQSWPDWEIVAVDDASSDGTFERLRSWAERDVRIVARRNDGNVGMTANWNRCLELARGHLVVKLDVDDAFRPAALESLSTACERRGVVAAGIRTLLCDEALEPVGALPADAAMMQAGIDPYRDSVLATGEWLRIASMGHQLWHSDAIMLRRTDLLEMGGWDERFGCASDTDLILRVLGRQGSVAHVSSVGVLYRQVDGSVSWQYRTNGWLQWEGIVTNLIALDRQRRASRLPRRLRWRQAQLWSLWKRFGVPGGAGETVSARVRENLSTAMMGVEPPDLLDRIAWRARAAVSSYSG